MTYAERIRLEEKLRYKVPKTQIARELGFSLQTIYNEIRRGSYQHEKDGFLQWRYSADRAQDIYEKRQRRKTGRPLKIGHDIAYADYLEQKIMKEHRSPAAALAEARRQGFTTTICVGTLYNYITGGVFYELTNANLPEKPTRKPRKKGEKPKIAHQNLPSIEHRPQYINERSEPGHWEMDLVVGPQGSKPVLLTMTERVSRKEIIIKLPDKRAATIRRAIDRLERNTPGFKQKFRSITTDNGSEFMEYELLKKSACRKGDRFQVYYCHSYAAWEKGTNENHNRMIRRFFPKGTDFSQVTQKQVAAVQDWMNGYPRKILGWKCPADIAV